MLQSTLGVVWFGPFRHALVTAGSSVVNAAPATFADAAGKRNSTTAAAATNVKRPAYRRRPRLLVIAPPSPLVDVARRRSRDGAPDSGAGDRTAGSILQPQCFVPQARPLTSVGPSGRFQQTAIARFGAYSSCCTRRPIGLRPIIDTLWTKFDASCASCGGAAEGNSLETDCGTILLVDDDAAFREFVRSLLSRIGYAIAEASDGDEALAAALAERPSLVLLDVDVPGISGYEICRALRDMYGEDLPIIFVSGRRTEQLDLVSGLLIGADDYVFKPFDAAELLARVRRHLSRAPHNPSVVNGVRLTPREQEILDLLAAGLDQRAIAEQLVISPKTVAYAHRHGLVDATPASV